MSTNCAICCHPPDAPFRRHEPKTGKIVEGCVGEAHTGHLYGASREWHNAPEGREIRRKTAEHLTKLIGEPMRGYGLPGKLDRSNRRGNSNRPSGL